MKTKLEMLHEIIIVAVRMCYEAGGLSPQTTLQILLECGMPMDEIPKQIREDYEP